MFRPSRFQLDYGHPFRPSRPYTCAKKSRFGLPVYTSRLVFPLPPHSATVVKGAELFDALAATSIQTGPFSGAAAEKDVASEARRAPVPGGPGASKTVCFQLFLKTEQHPGSARRKMSKSWVGPKVPKWPLAREQSTFSKIVFLRLRESRRQQN